MKPSFASLLHHLQLPHKIRTVPYDRKDWHRLRRVNLEILSQSFNT